MFPILSPRPAFAGAALALALASARVGHLPAAPVPASPLVDPEATAGARRASPAKPASAAASKPPADPPLPTTGTVILANWSGGKYTTDDLSSTLAWRRPPSASGQTVGGLLTGPRETLRKVVRDLVYEQAVLAKARAAGIDENTTEIAARLEDARANAVNRVIMERDVVPRILKTDQRAARDYYEQNKATLFTLPGRLLVRNLHFPTYREFVAGEGDTLTSIAKSIAGDESAKRGILRGDSLHYPRIPVTPGVPAVEPKVGEKLLVPLPAATAATARDSAEAARRELETGAAIEAVAARHPGVVTPLGGKPYPPEAVDMPRPEYTAAVKAMEAGTSVSPVLALPTGYSVLLAAVRTSTVTQTFEQVQDKANKAVAGDTDRRTKTNEQIRRELFEEMRARHNLTVDEAILKRKDHGGTDPLVGTTPIATAPGFVFTLDEYLAELRVTERSWSAMGFDERMDVVKSARPVTRFLFRKQAEQEGLGRLPAIQGELASKAVIEITAAYLRQRQVDIMKAADETAFREFHKTHVDRYTSPSRVTLREIAKRVNYNQPEETRNRDIEKAKAALVSLKATLKTKEDFERAARRESESIATRSRGGLVGTVDVGYRGDILKNQVVQLKPGEVGDPILIGSEILLLRVDSVEPPVVRPYEEIANRVKQDYFREVPMKTLDEFRDQTLAEAGYKLAI